MAVTPKKTGLAAITDIEAPAYTQKDQDVASNVAAVANKGGALMKQAETAGLQQANRRGLLSSSMAVGAAQDSVLKQATAIGGQNAAQNAANNLSRQGFEQGRVLQGDSILSTERENLAQREFTAGESQKDRSQQTALQQSDQKFTAGQSALDRTQQTALQKDQQKFAADQANRDRNLQQLLQKEQAGTQLTLQERELKANLQKQNADAKQSQLDRELQTKLAGWNLDDSERGQVADLLKSYETVYEQAIAEINNNTKLKAEDREAQIKAATARRNKRVSLLEDLYNVDVSF